MRLIRGRPNPAGAFDALYLLAGDAVAAPVAGIDGAEALPRLAPGESRRLRIVHFNDLHNYLTLPNAARGDSHVFAQIVRRHRTARAAAAADEIVLLLSGGDDHTGSVLDELVGWKPEELIVDPAYAAYSAAGVELATLGNHELDRGAAVLQAGIRASAAFPILSANIHGSPALVASRDYFPGAIALAKGLRIGFIGLTTPVDTRTHTSLDLDLAVASPLQVLRNMLPAVAALSDIVVVMSHCGYGTDSNLDGKAGAHRHLAEGDIAVARSAAALTDKPLLVLGGHTHTVLNEAGLGPDTLIDDVPIIQAGGLGSHVGEFRAVVTVGAPRAAMAPQATLHPLKRRDVRAPSADSERDADFDAEFEARVIAPLLRQVDGRLKEVVATVAAGEEVSPATTLRQRYLGESALVNFVADGLVARSAEFPQGAVDLAIVNSTAVGDGISPQGPLTFQHWYGVMTFADCLQVGRLSGRQLREILDNNAKRIVRPEELAGAAPPNLKAYVSRG
ncbi:MAG: bifunctional metallophosphatase/5'-nucleotidase, partial [Proteobacteria bacterium]|nr:bifunctional metallophosphatase/5'-nucleotidase [Pseudomonadota bacterium]